jgi:two-component system cell cycle sensor histidine kinase/response regulator CckA
MAKKPTYKELEQRLEELEREALERMQAEDALRETEQRLRDLVEGSIQGILIHKNLKPLFLNKAWADIHGYTVDEILKMDTVAPLLAPHDRSQLSKYNDARLRGADVPTHYEYQGVRKDGSLIWVENMVRPVTWQGQPAVQATIFDITKHKRAEEALRESEAQKKAILDAAVDRIRLTDPDLKIVWANKTHKRELGISPEDAIGKYCYKVFADRDNPCPECPTIKALKSGTIEHAILVRSRPGGGNGKRYLDSYAVPITDESGTNLNTIQITRDVTAQVLTEQRLRESEASYRELANSITDVFFALDKNLKYTYWNKASEELTQITARDALGKSLLEVFPDTPQTMRAEKEYREVLKTGQPKTFVNEYQLGGKGYFFEISAYPARAGLSVFVKDITDRKQAEEALRESENKYRRILKSIEESYYEVDLAGNLTFFNDSTCRILGYSRDELIDMNNQDFMDQQNAGKIFETFNKVYTTGEPAKGSDWAITRKDGTKRYLEASVSLIRDAEGQPIGFRGIGRDVTERKQMEGELIQTKNFLQSILDSSIDGITTTDLHGTVTYTTPKVKDILGYEQGERIGKTVSMIYANGKEDARAIMKELTESGELRDHEMRLIRKDGELIDINLSSSLLRDESGEVIGTLGIYRDITEKKRLEAQFQAAQRMEAMGTLAGGIAHNFNNLLMAIQGNASLMLLEKASEHPDYERLKSIEQAVRSGAELTRQLIGFAMAGKYEVKPTDINELIERSSDMFGRTKRQITIHRKYQEGIWPVEVDQGQIEQALLNLYVNAWQAMPGGGELYLETENVTLDDKSVKPFDLKAGRYVKISVTDTGVGMDKTTQQRIFEPFFTTKEMGRGTGLGLASVYGIITNHGGIITVESKRGEGATFIIYLPASDKELIKEEQFLPGEVLRGTDTVLLVDDEEMVLEVGEEILKELGYTVLMARSGNEAIDLLSKGPNLPSAPDLVILDMIMPGMAGGETYDRLKEIDPDIKVLLSSGYSIDGQAQEIMDRGCNGFIQKPFSMRELSGRIREILDKEKRAPSIQRLASSTEDMAR